MNPQNEGQNFEQPVAYTPEGQPLYAHPAVETQAKSTASPSEEPQVVYLTRAIEPHQQEVPEDIQQKHLESVKQYPHLNLSEGEFIISAIRRHPIGLWSIWLALFGMLILVVGGAILLVNSGVLPFSLSDQTISYGVAMLWLFGVLVVLGGVISTVVYNSNRFYLTSESVIQETQLSLFNKNSQTISLGSVEDASFVQRGIIQTMLNYGSIRLSTEGEETTYRFSYVANPKKQIDLLNNAIESFKNFRPIEEDEN